MKRISCLVIGLFMVISAFGWGRVGHATVAKIAEDHLTPTTQKAIAEILNGHSIVEYASFADEYKNKPILAWNYGIKFNDAKTVQAFPHTFEANMDFQPFRGVSDNGRFVKNCIPFIVDFSEQLKDYKSMEDTARFVKLVMVVHWLGDMHCPEHIRYNPEDMTIGYYNVTYKGAPLRYHTFWDDQCITDRWPWGFSELAYLWDRATEEEIAEIVKGDPYDWGYDSAKCSWPIHSIKEGDTIKGDWLLEQKALVSSQITKAGYRLAHLLNCTFDKKYAKKHSK